MNYSAEEIVRSYRQAKDQKAQIKILAELNTCSVEEIRRVLADEGVLAEEPQKAKSPAKRFDAERALALYGEGGSDEAIAEALGVSGDTVTKWRRGSGLRKLERKPRMKRFSGMETVREEKDTVEEAKTAAGRGPVTVEELRALLEDACQSGIGECPVLVEGTAFADIWLDVHSEMRLYESGAQTVELKGTAKRA